MQTYFTSHSMYLKLRSVVLALTCLLIASCGGGSSSSGGQPAPIPPTATLYGTGTYSGEIDFLFAGENIIDTQDEPTPFSLQVIGNVAGGQQVRIAFQQFSGTSIISDTGAFSIPSGDFQIPVRDRAGRVTTRCTGMLLFDGSFGASSVAGTVTSTSQFVCADSRLGPISVTGTFEVTFGSSSKNGGSSDLGVRAINLGQ